MDMDRMNRIMSLMSCMYLKSMNSMVSLGLHSRGDWIFVVLESVIRKYSMETDEPILVYTTMMKYLTSMNFGIYTSLMMSFRGSKYCNMDTKDIEQHIKKEINQLSNELRVTMNSTSSLS